MEVQPGRVYEGSLLGASLDELDHYVFQARAGDVLQTSASGVAGCTAVLTEAGALLASACVEGVQLVPIQVVLPADGRYYYRYDALQPDRYWFSLGLNDDAPAVPVSAQDDAGSGRDAPDVPAPFVRVEAGPVYEGILLGLVAFHEAADHYAFDGLAGQAVDVVATGDIACLAFLDSTGAELASGCITTLLQKVPLRAVLPADGLYYLRYASVQPQHYWFSLAFDAPARGIPTEQQDDAGSGRDAPDTPAPLVEIRSGQTYEGLAVADLLVDWQDHYLFHGKAGDAVDVLATGEEACLSLLHADGTELVRRCLATQGQQHTLRAVLPAEGSYYFRYHAFQPSPYWFSLGINEEAPDLLLDLQDDAGSGRDAPAEPAPHVRVDAGKVYAATVLGEASDRSDLFAFEAKAGDVVDVRATASVVAFLDVVDGSGTRLAGTLVFAETRLGAVRVALPADGTYYVEYTALQPDLYWFSLGLNQKAPALPVDQPRTIA